MIFGTALIWIPVTFLTQPVPQAVLQNFFRKVNPPGFWKGWQREAATNQAELKIGLWNWVIGTAALFFTTFGLIDLFLMRWLPATVCLVLSAMGWWLISVNGVRWTVFGKQSREPETVLCHPECNEGSCLFLSKI